MKFVGTTWLVLSFTALAALGFLAMSEDMAHQACLASTLAGSLCPEENVFDYAFFHLAAFKSFSLALVFVLLVAGHAIFALFAPRVFIPEVIISQARRAEKGPSPLAKSLRKWLALHENSR